LATILDATTKGVDAIDRLLEQVAAEAGLAIAQVQNEMERIADFEPDADADITRGDDEPMRGPHGRYWVWASCETRDQMRLLGEILGSYDEDRELDTEKLMQAAALYKAEELDRG
jgi:esterase/lipase superfamily enzyme